MIPIRDAMLCSNCFTKSIGVMEHPAKNFRELGFNADIGASFSQWADWSDDKRALALITEGLNLVEECGFDLAEVLAALRQVTECKAALEDHFA